MYQITEHMGKCVEYNICERYRFGKWQTILDLVCYILEQPKEVSAQTVFLLPWNRDACPDVDDVLLASFSLLKKRDKDTLSTPLARRACRLLHRIQRYPHVALHNQAMHTLKMTFLLASVFPGTRGFSRVAKKLNAVAKSIFSSDNQTVHPRNSNVILWEGMRGLIKRWQPYLKCPDKSVRRIAIMTCLRSGIRSPDVYTALHWLDSADPNFALKLRRKYGILM